MNYTGAFYLNGKVALITGASKGIGEGIARCYAAYGAKVIINSRKQVELDKVASSIREEGGECAGIEANTADVKSCEYLVEKVVAEFGRLDILVNNAATNPIYGPLIKSEEWAFNKIMDVNLKGPFALANFAHRHLKEGGGGAVLNISSIAGLTPDPGLGLYSISKAALNMLTKVQAKEWGKDGIRVNAICPGLIKTKFSEALWSDEKILRRMVSQLPIARMGTVEEIALLALYLVSPASGYCTGSVFMADGGTVI